MGRAINLTGQRFGRLTALRDVGAIQLARGSSRLWELACDCGRTVRQEPRILRTGRVRSCGCLQAELTSASKTSDMAGKRFGRLVVMERADVDRHGSVRWRCLCDCGVSLTIIGASMRRGTTRSCGCLHREVARKIGDRSRKDKPVSRTKEYRSALRARLRAIPERAAAERVSRMLGHALSKINAVKSGRTFDMLGYSPATLREHLERQFERGMSWENRSDWEVDHIIPIATAKSVAEVIALNQLSNLRPLWKRDNNEKRARRTHLL